MSETFTRNEVHATFDGHLGDPVEDHELANYVAAVRALGVTVVDPTPPVPVGTAGTATVRGVKGVRVFRYMPDGTPRWISSERPEGEGILHNDDQVTDFVPDVVVTDEWKRKTAEELIEFLGYADSQHTYIYTAVRAYFGVPQ